MVSEIDGEPSYASLPDVPESVDLVNVFRRSEYLPEIFEEAIAIGAKTCHVCWFSRTDVLPKLWVSGR